MSAVEIIIENRCKKMNEKKMPATQRAVWRNGGINPAESVVRK